MRPDEGDRKRIAGFDKALYFLQFDHRGSFQTGMFGWTGRLTLEQTAQIAAAKQVIYDAFKATVALGVAKDRAGILVDEQFGSIILRDAAANGYTTACPVMKSGQFEFDFEFGDDFARHLEAFHPTFSKALVRYNSEGDHDANQRQSARLRRLSDYLLGWSESRLMVEVQVPAARVHLHLVNGDRQAYDRQLRPGLMVEAIEQLQDAGVEAAVWEIEGLDRREDYERIVAVVRRGGREDAGCIVLGRGEDGNRIHEWLATASDVAGITGFAAGRICFWDSIAAWRENRLGRAEAVARIACCYRGFVDIFEETPVRHGEGRPCPCPGTESRTFR